MHKYMTCQMQDGSVWAVPVDVIARNRAEHYAREFSCSVDRSLFDNTIPDFEADTDNIEEWAVNNMNWSDFAGSQVKVSSPEESGPSEEWWVNGSKGFLDDLPTTINYESHNLAELVEWATKLGAEWQTYENRALSDELMRYAKDWQADINMLQNARKP